MGHQERKKYQNVLSDAVNFLKQNGIELYGINKNPDQLSWTNSPKVYGHLYIDDAAVGCPLIYPEKNERPYVDWNKVGEEILKITSNNLKKTH